VRFCAELAYSDISSREGGVWMTTLTIAVSSFIPLSPASVVWTFRSIFSWLGLAKLRVGNSHPRGRRKITLYWRWHIAARDPGFGFSVADFRVLIDYYST